MLPQWNIHLIFGHFSTCHFCRFRKILWKSSLVDIHCFIYMRVANSLLLLQLLLLIIIKIIIINILMKSYTLINSTRSWLNHCCKKHFVPVPKLVNLSDSQASKIIKLKMQKLVYFDLFIYLFFFTGSIINNFYEIYQYLDIQNIKRLFSY